MVEWANYGIMALMALVVFGLGHCVGSDWLYFGKKCLYYSGPELGCQGPCGCSLRGERKRLLAMKQNLDAMVASCPEEIATGGLNDRA